MAARRVLSVAGEGLLGRRSVPHGGPASCVLFSTSSNKDARHHKLLIVGGGTAGAATANKFGPKLGKEEVCVIEPHETHYNQPMWTLVGAGLKQFDQSGKKEVDILPKQCTWIQDKVKSFDPDNNMVTTHKGEVITYDYMVLTMGITLDFYKIEGCLEALKNDPFVCSNYSPLYVEKTWDSLRKIESGNAIFSLPDGPVKCAGAPQKACYLAEEYFRKTGKRDKVNVIYNTSLPAIYSVPRYSVPLQAMADSRNIEVHVRRNLVKVDHKKKLATFELLDSKTGETEDYEYSMLHVAPPMCTPKALWDSPLVDDTKFVTVDKETLQHTKYPNVFSSGDCTNTPTSKTAAAIAGQTGVVANNLQEVMRGAEPSRKYNGYTSCPLIVTKNTCVLAEFGYDGVIMETFPVNQAKPRFSMAFMKRIIMPPLYWFGLVKGLWHGPGHVRKLLRLGFKTSN